MNKNNTSGLITEFEHGDAEPIGRVCAIIRHGQTKLNAADKIRGWSDVPLDAVGHEQAQELGIQMREDGIELDGLITSDLVRSVQTSLHISRETGIPILGTTKALRPWDVGSYTAQDGKMVHAIMAKAARTDPDTAIGGGESFNIFKHRILTGIIGILNSHRGLRIGLVSHSRGERILHGWVEAGCPEDLDIDLDTFLDHGVGTATAELITINCPLVLS